MLFVRHLAYLRDRALDLPEPAGDRFVETASGLGRADPRSGAPEHADGYPVFQSGDASADCELHPQGRPASEFRLERITKISYDLVIRWRFG